MLKYKVKAFSYKFKVIIEKPMFMSKRRLVSLIERSLLEVPNYSVQWNNGSLILNLYFDSSGFKKDLSKTVVHASNGFVSLQRTECD